MATPLFASAQIQQCRTLLEQTGVQPDETRAEPDQNVQVPAGVMRLTTVNGQNRAAFVDNKRNMRKCNCHASVTLIGSILSLVIILRITTKSQSSKNKSSARLRAPRLSEPMTAADRAVVALRTRRHNRSDLYSD